MTCRASKYQKHNLKYPPYRTLYTARTEIPPLQLHVTLHGPPGRYRLSVGLTKDGTALAACSTVTDCAIPCTDRVLPRAASAHLVPTLPQHTHTSTSASSRAPRRREETVGPKRAGRWPKASRPGRWPKARRPLVQSEANPQGRSDGAPPPRAAWRRGGVARSAAPLPPAGPEASPSGLRRAVRRAVARPCPAAASARSPAACPEALHPSALGEG